MRLLWKFTVMFLVVFAFASTVNGGYEFQATFSPIATPHLVFNKNNFYLNLYGDRSDVLKNLNLTFSISDKVYLNSMELSTQFNSVNSVIFIKAKKGTSKDWLNIISADKIGNNYMGLILQSPGSYFFYGLPDFSDTSEYKTMYFQQRFNYQELFFSLLYCSRSSWLKTKYEDLYAGDFTYKLGRGSIKGEIGFENSNNDADSDFSKRSFFMLGYQNDGDYITYTQFSKDFNYSISSYQPMMKTDFKFGSFSGWYYKNLKIGGEYQPKIVDGKVEFSYYDPNASAVNLAGSFNGWSTVANPMTKNSNGVWTVDMPLSPGTYQYKFVVDGSRWVEDPCGFDYADDGYGGFNSVLTIIQTDSGIAISAPKDKFAINFSSPTYGNLSFESNLRDEVNQMGNYLYKLSYHKDFNGVGLACYIGYPEDNTRLEQPDSYSVLISKRGTLGNLNYEIGFKPLLYSPNFTDTQGYINLSYSKTKLNFSAFSNNTYSVYAETNIDFPYGTIYLKGLTDFKNFTAYSNISFNCFSPAIVQFSMGNEDFNTYKQFVNELGLYLKTTF